MKTGLLVIREYILKTSLFQEGNRGIDLLYYSTWYRAGKGRRRGNRPYCPPLRPLDDSMKFPMTLLAEHDQVTESLATSTFIGPVVRMQLQI